MDVQDLNYDSERGQISFRLPVPEVKLEIVDRLKAAGLVNLEVNYRHFDAMRVGNRTYNPDFVPPPYIDAVLEKLGNGSNGLASIRFEVSQKAGEHASDGRKTILEIAKVLGIQ